MARQDFQNLEAVDIDHIDLDTTNARIRFGSSQEDCIRRVLRKSEQLLELMKSIATEGLSTMPILLSPNPDIPARWIVKDGNRRMTSLKLLKNPGLCPDPIIKSRIEKIKQDARFSIEKVDCLVSESEDAIRKEVIARHSGSQGGAGQLDWSAYLRTIFLLNNNLSVEYKRAGQYCFWAEEHHIQIDDDFPISSVQRFFNEANIRALGFEIVDDELTPTLPIAQVEKMANRIFYDFGNGIKNVEDIRYKKQGEDYINEVRASVGLPNIGEQDNDKNKNKNEPNEGGEDTTSGEDNGDDDAGDTDGGKGKSDGKREYPPTKPSWDRSRLFYKGSPAPIIPIESSKARNVVLEIKKLNVEDNPIATSILLRILIELSVTRYLRIKGLTDKDSLAKNVILCSDHLFENNLIGDDARKVVKAIANSDPQQYSLVSIASLQKMIHSDHFHPSKSVINTLWDEMGSFIRAIWQVK